MTTVDTLERPLILYFGQNEKGPISRLYQTGKFVFKHRSANFKPGFVKVTKLHQQEQYCFAEGENIESQPLTFALVQELFWKELSELKSFEIMKTTEDVNVIVMKYGYTSQRVLFIHEDGKVEYFAKDIIEQNTNRSLGKYWETVQPLFEQELNQLRQEYLFAPLRKVHSRFYTDWLQVFYAENTILQEFETEFNENRITFLDLTEGYELGPRGKIRDYFYRRFLGFSPLVIDTQFYGVEKTKELLERIRVYNATMLYWWKEKGLSQIEDETYRNGIESELSKILYWESV